MGALDAAAITVGAMVGSGLFSSPAEVAQVVPSGPAVLGVWLAGGALSLLGALTFAEPGASIPEAGGLSVWLSRGLGEGVGFAFSWAMLVVLVPTSTAWFAQLAAHNLAQLAALAGLRPGPEVLWALGVLGFLLALNLAGVRVSARAQTVMTAVKCVLVLLLGAAGWLARPGGAVASSGGAVAPSALVVALVGVLWTYDGWLEVTSVGAEVKDPERSVPRALVLGTVAVVALYLFAVGGWLHALGAGGLAGESVPLERLVAGWGRAGRAVVLAAVASCTLGGAAVGFLTGTRVALRVTDSVPWLASLSRPSERGVPARGLCAVMALAAACVLSPLGRLGEVFVVGAWPFYALGAVAVWRLRVREPALERPVRVWGYPVVPAVFAAVSLAMCVGYLVVKPGRTLLSAGVILLGPAVRWVSGRRGR